MRPLTHAEQAVLSLVAERPRHGYEIEQVIRERGMRDWADLGFSSIYYLLVRLERRGLVCSERRASRQGPARRVYHSTAAGRSELRRAVRRAFTHPELGDSPVQLALANLPVLSPPEAARALRLYRDHLIGRQAFLRRRGKELSQMPHHVRAMFTRSSAMLQAEIRWADAYLRNMLPLTASRRSRRSL